MTQGSPAASMMRSYSEAVGAASATQWRPGPSPASAHDLRARAGLPPARTVGDILGPPFTSAKEPLDPRAAVQPLLGHPVGVDRRRSPPTHAGGGPGSVGKHRDRAKKASSFKFTTGSGMFPGGWGHSTTRHNKLVGYDDTTGGSSGESWSPGDPGAGEDASDYWGSGMPSRSPCTMGFEGEAECVDWCLTRCTVGGTTDFLCYRNCAFECEGCNQGGWGGWTTETDCLYPNHELGENCPEDFFRAAECMIVNNFDIVETWYDRAGADHLDRLRNYFIGDETLEICCGDFATSVMCVTDPYAATLADWFAPSCMYFCDWYLDWLQEAWDAAGSNSDRTCLILDLAAVLLHETVHFSSRAGSWDWLHGEAKAWSLEGYFRVKVAQRLSVDGNDYCCARLGAILYDSKDKAAKFVLAADQCR